MGGGKTQMLIIGFLIMLGYFAASFLSGVINSVLFMFFPATGALSLVGLVISLAVFAFILGFVVLWLIAKFGK